MNEITNKDLQELKRQLDKWDLTFHKSCKDKTFHLKNGKRHREDGPALICFETMISWYYIW
jgi:hypothetical protein